MSPPFETNSARPVPAPSRPAAPTCSPAPATPHARPPAPARPAAPPDYSSAWHPQLRKLAATRVRAGSSAASLEARTSTTRARREPLTTGVGVPAGLSAADAASGPGAGSFQSEWCRRVDSATHERDGAARLVRSVNTRSRSRATKCGKKSSARRSARYRRTCSLGVSRWDAALNAWRRATEWWKTIRDSCSL
jgi:hypothetical protein